MLTEQLDWEKTDGMKMCIRDRLMIEKSPCFLRLKWFRLKDIKCIVIHREFI